MRNDEFIQYVKHPESISEKNQAEFLELSNKYPYFSLAKWMYLKSLHVAESVYFEQELKKNTLYAQDRRNLYYYIHPDVQHEYEAVNVRSNSTGSYFDMIGKLDEKGENNKTTLSSLAEKLRAAREMLQVEPEKKEEPIPVQVEEEVVSEKGIEMVELMFEEKEKEAKSLIREKKYREAIEILEELNLINPKKSIYFADQIRFLRKIIEIS